MSVASPDRNPDLLKVPDSLKEQLSSFRGKVWTTKMAEALALAAVAVLLAFLTVFVIDRFVDTPQSVRAGIFFAMLAVWMVVPWALHRWVWKNRTLDQLARLLRVREPNIGDQLLGVIELADSETEQARSRKLCEAAIEQVADSAKKRDLNKAAPQSRVKLWSTVLAIAGAIAIVLGIFAGPAAKNALARMIAPWSDTPRYTFTAVNDLPDTMVVPHGENVTWTVSLADTSRWHPETASIELPGMLPTVVSISDDKYEFELPPRTAPTDMMVRVGDFYQSVTLDPKIRPELIAADAMVELPEYLQIPGKVRRDVRSGTLSVVEGSTASVAATASRELDSASINGESVAVDVADFASSTIDIKRPAEVVAAEQANLESQLTEDDEGYIAEDAEYSEDDVVFVAVPEPVDEKMLLDWKDLHGLAGREPFELSIRPLADESPSVVTQDLPRQAVLLDSEQLNFRALSADDFGVKRIGMSWKGLDDKLTKPAKGERILKNGGPEESSVQADATFSATSFGIDPQPIEVRMWVEDYLPGRERVYSAPHIFFVLTPEEHAIWVTNQMSKWHRAALDVRDREMRLFERNKQLRAMTADQLADDAMRNELRKQAGAEASNGRRLSNLNKKGEELIKMASRNPEIGVGHLERWAEMQQILKDISANRMPSVSDLLSKASTDEKVARGPSSPSKPKKDAPKAGQNRNDKMAAGDPEEEDPDAKETPAIPNIADAESSQQPLDDLAKKDEKQPPKKGAPRLTLPSTTIASPGKPKDNPEECEVPEEPPVDEAIKEQEDLLAEFEKVADELNTVLANLEGSTLVKRLKAASREQDQVADRIGGRIDSVFGAPKRVQPQDAKLLSSLSEVEKKSSQVVSYIMDDMQSYYERRRMIQFKNVLEEMKTAEVLNALTDLGEKIPKKQGMSIAQAEFWSDSFDRWADDLVDPMCGGS